MRFERRDHPSRVLTVLAPVGAIVAALLVSGLLIALAGANPIRAYGLILKGAFGSRLGLSEMLTRATPLILTGLAAAVAFRARLWNIGGEGQFYLGALGVTAFGMIPAVAAMPAGLVIPLSMAAGAVAGMILLLVPLGLRLKFGV
ncbi:MAG: ABC transporter permease, partial [Pseudomonadota bacterium]|nr:ABC transporter permease [Pseudomonadota bacterium]